MHKFLSALWAAGEMIELFEWTAGVHKSLPERQTSYLYHYGKKRLEHGLY